jgi:ubiquinone/menaquinone biosynthesis C-methylase UbiE
MQARKSPGAKSSPKEISLSIVVPVYNERRTIREVLKRIKATPQPKEIIIVDDCSSDGTRHILKQLAADPEIRIFFQPSNTGKGAALRRGFQEAKNDVVIVQDADLEYDPQDYEVLLRPIKSGRADVVYGSRFLHGERRVLFFWHSIGNRLLTTLSNMFTDLNLSDMETCYKAFKREIIQNIMLESDRFGFEPEITAKVARLGCSIYEVPVNYYGRSYAEGKKITWRDGLAAFSHILRFSLSKKPFLKNEAEIRRVLAMPPEDPDVGVETLEAFEAAPLYNSWIVERLKPYLGPALLEVGSGIGNIAAEVLKSQKIERYLATDYSAKSLEVVSQRFGDDSRIFCQVWDAAKAIPAAIETHRFDSIICSNVLEHIQDHKQALQNMRALLKPQGKLVLLVPAHEALFSELDRKLEHQRRYSRDSLQQLLQQSGFDVLEITPHNFVGALAWWWSGKIIKQTELSQCSVRRFDQLVPMLKPFDGLLTWLFSGVSYIAIASPKESSA